MGCRICGLPATLTLLGLLYFYLLNLTTLHSEHNLKLIHFYTFPSQVPNLVGALHTVGT